MYTVYKIENKENGKIYIGVTRNFEKRKYEHFWRLEKGKHPNWKISQYFKDKNNLTISIIEKCSENQKFIKEKYWINFYKSNVEGYNLDNGGNKGKKRNEESLIISRNKAPKGYRNKNSRKIILVNTKEIFESINEAQRKYNFISPSLISQCCNGRIKRGGVNEKGEALIWEYLENYKEENEYNFKPNDFTGSSNNNSKKIFCLNNEKEYGSLSEAARELNLTTSKISLVCNGKRKHTGGYKFKFVK